MGRTVLTEAEQVEAATVFKEHRPFIESVARQHSPHPQDVPDIIQAVGIKICQSLSGFQGRAKLESWLFRVTVNAARDHHRRESRKVRVVERLDMLDPQTEAVFDGDPAILSERQKAVQEAINQLRDGRDGRGRFTDERRVALALLDGDEPTQKHKKGKAKRQAVLDQLREILAKDPRITTNGNGTH